jgi:RimJ/RimL family protein N-acetyltransferase
MRIPGAAAFRETAMPEIAEVLHTPRCRIAALTQANAQALQAITDASVTARIGFLPEPFTLADARAIIARSESERFYGVWDGEGGSLNGVIGVHPGDRRAIEIGYWFSAAARGQGLASEAVTALVAELAIAYPAHRIVAECHPDNRPSWALLERIGFQPNGCAGRRPGRRLFVWGESETYRFDVC